MEAITKARIRRASQAAQGKLHSLDADARRQLTALFTQALQDVEREIQAAASLDGTVKLYSMARLKQQINQRLEQLNQARDSLLGQQLAQAAGIGSAPFIGVAAQLQTVTDDALLQTVHFIAEDGLQLSDRLWRINEGARQVIANQVEQAIIRGDSAVRAAMAYLQQNITVPPDVQRKIGAAQADKISKATGRDLMKKNGPYHNALRVFRTEINRAHGEAYQAAAFSSEDVIGTKFLLSPHHPQADICDMHAKVNRYGLGPGVYPQGRNPWPAHPNTLSFTVAVFKDEVTPADRAGKQDRISWLKDQTPARQQSILNSRKKAAALKRDILKENQIATNWQDLKKRYQKQGIDTDSL